MIFHIFGACHMLSSTLTMILICYKTYSNLKTKTFQFIFMSLLSTIIYIMRKNVILAIKLRSKAGGRRTYFFFFFFLIQVMCLIRFLFGLTVKTSTKGSSKETKQKMQRKYQTHQSKTTTITIRVSRLSYQS